MKPPEPTTRLAFVVCPSFHGATLLALLLNNHSQLSALGDTIPSREFDQVCACGARVSQCDFWQTVASRIGAERFADLKTLIPILPWPLAHRGAEGGAPGLSDSPVANRVAGRLAAAVVDAAVPLLWRWRTGPVADYAATYRSFYDLVCQLHGTSIVVDGSKSWRKVAALTPALAGKSSSRVIHLVRDPRAFVASCRHNGAGTDLRALTWQWVDLHRRMVALRETAAYRVVRYEDLCLHTKREMEGVFDFLGIEGEDVIAAPRYRDKHHLMGNKMLFEFSGDIRLDERWRHELTPLEQTRVLRHANGLVKRLGYC